MDLLALAAALALVLVPWLWRRCRHVVTIAHEGAHALVAVLTGRKLSGVRLHRDTSGLTTSRGRNSGPGMVLTVAAGYPGPGLVGLGAAYGVQRDHPDVVLWTLLVLLALLVLWVRNLYGFVVVLLAGGAVFAVTWWGSADLQAGVARTAAWFLLLASPRTVLEMQAVRTRRRSRTSDADVLGRLTHLPGLVWVVLLFAIGGAMLVAGAALLLPSGGVR